MKRIIREVITLVRIERWLVRDDPSPASPFLDEQLPEVQTQEITLNDATTASEDLRVIAQRILESKQWEFSTQEDAQRSQNE